MLWYTGRYPMLFSLIVSRSLSSAGIAWNSNTLDRFTQPGRYFGINAVAKW